MGHAHFLAFVGRFCEFSSAIFGVLGTALMTRRCAPHILRSLVYAASSPILFVLGQGRRVRDFFVARAKINWDNPESPADMMLGMNLLFWAFFFQLISLLAK